MAIHAIIFDLDNTLAHTENLRLIRETGDYEQLTPEILSNIKLYKPVANILQEIKKADIKLGLVTNSGRTYANRLLQHLNIKEYFDVIVTYTDVGADGMKPSPKGILLALQQLNLEPSKRVIYVGDEDKDMIASYRAGIAPILPTWASRKAITTAPSMELSSTQLIDFLKNPDEYQLFAEKGETHQSYHFDRKATYFLPLDSDGNIVTLKEQMRAFCLGRYFSQKTPTTARLHQSHDLSKKIAEKNTVNQFNAPDHWIEILSHVIRHGEDFFNEEDITFDLVTVIPHKGEKYPRLEVMLDKIAEKLDEYGIDIECIADIFYFIEGAASQKTLGRSESLIESKRTLKLNPKYANKIKGKNILVLDDVITTGATLSTAYSVLEDQGASIALGLAISKTVSIFDDEKDCPLCARTMTIRKNRSNNTFFWGCSGYKDTVNQCSYTESLDNKDCPKCGRAMRVFQNKRTKEHFWSCSGYNQHPSCNHSENYDESERVN